MSYDTLTKTLAGGLVKGHPQFGATGGKPVTQRSLGALDWSNFFLSDVRDGIGPYLGIYLLAQPITGMQGSIGVAMAVMGIAMVVAQAPAGVLIDATTHKTLVMAGEALVVAISCLLMTVFPSLAAAKFSSVSPRQSSPRVSRG